ncbi:MAG: hypothetical protein IJE58_02995 [Oscillospiraceae bacterium]|nr:hypothetical protein [Oscillospiraceae bacterium]
MIDIYRILPEEWFEQIGEPSNDEEQYAPIDYDFVGTALYTGNSFFGPEKVDLLVDADKGVYYICSALRQPVGDYGWSTVWLWYKSDKSKYSAIKSIVENERGNIVAEGDT